MDDLKDFILNGNARDVDAWFAEKCMGLSVDSNAYMLIGETKYESSGVKIERLEVIPYYTTDRRLSHDIEDRVKDLKLSTQYALALVDFVDQEEYYALAYWGLLRATNRQRILAAARAMGLSLTNPEGLDDSDKGKTKSSPD